MTGKTALMSNYTQGFAGGLNMRGANVLQQHTGKIFWVADGDTAGTTPANANSKTPSDGNAGTYLAPFKTLDYAVGQCLADRGDIIYVMPGYSQDIAAAAGVDFDVDGITVVGLGKGDKQPLLSYSVATSTVEVNGDNITLEGLHFASSVTVVALGLNVLDGSDDFTIRGCRFTCLGGALTTDEFEDSLSITTSDRFLVEDCYFDMDEGADSDSAIHLVGICLGGTIRNNYITGDYTVGCIESITTAQEQIVIEGNTLMNGVHGGLNTVACISLVTATSGVIQNNNLYTNVASPLTGAIVSNGTFNLNNRYASTTGGAVLGDSIGAGAMELTIADGVEAAHATAFTIDGGVVIHGLWGVTTTAADTTNSFVATCEATSTPASLALIAVGETHTATAVGDIVYATTPGGSATVVEAASAETISPLWPGGISVTGAETIVDIVTEAGALEHTLFMLWSPVTAGAEVLETLA